jgi:uncharacterized protein with FMN-binding domain
MKKYILPVIVVVAFGVYVLLSSQKSMQVTTLPVAPTETNTGTSASANPATNTGSGSGSTTGQYKDGSYTGSAASAYFGNLQVVAVISGGKIVDVQFPVYPNDNGHTQEISSTDLPILKQEAIQAQSANVDIVSGATQTSQAFQQSLASALAMAK